MVVANFSDGSTKVYTKSLFQHDKGQRLSFEGIEASSSREVHFSNQPEGGIAMACKMHDNSVGIPDVYLSTGDYVYAWLYATKATSGSDGNVNYHITDANSVNDKENLVVDGLTSSKVASEDSETLFQVIIPVIKRPNIIRASDVSGDGDADGDVYHEFEYDVDGEGAHVTNTGNDGAGAPGIQGYTVNEGEENLTFFGY
jgi:hypothetical protein